MEMPEGFLRFEEWCDNFDAARKFNPSGHKDITLSTAARLMREMAECLELYKYISHKSDPRDVSHCSAAAEVLGKFKEWK